MKMLKSFIIILVLNLISTLYACDLVERCKVLRVVDGDTVEVNYAGEKEMVRLYGIDTPEKGEAGFAEARDKVKQLVDGKFVRIILPLKNKKRDNFGRLLGILFILENAMINSKFKTVNEFLYNNGFVRQYMDSLNLINNPKAIEQYLQESDTRNK